MSGKDLVLSSLGCLNLPLSFGKRNQPAIQLAIEIEHENRGRAGSIPRWDHPQTAPSRNQRGSAQGLARDPRSGTRKHGSYNNRPEDHMPSLSESSYRAILPDRDLRYQDAIS